LLLLNRRCAHGQKGFKSAKELGSMFRELAAAGLLQVSGIQIYSMIACSDLKRGINQAFGLLLHH